MRKIESFIGYALTALFLYTFIELLFGISGVIQYSPTFWIPFRVNGFAVLAGLFLSGIAGSIFPLWSVEKYLNTMKIDDIQKFITRYKVNYYQNMIGFIGLLLWCGAKQNFDIFWWFGLPFIILYFWWLFLIPIITRNK